jgi:hypothetical protein
MIVRSYLLSAVGSPARGRASTLLLALAALACASAPTPAMAQSIADCGNIYVEANATCEVTAPSVNCDVACEPLNLRAACAGEAYVDCKGSCNAELDIGCSASCEASCTAECTVDPGAFDCQAYCQADCSGSCTAECASSGDKTRCEAACKGSCSGDCAANCNVRAPSATCQADCKASCTGSCHAKANIDCQVMCQSNFTLTCEAELSGGCKADCMSEQGALFCEGNYVDSGNNLDQCVQALKDSLNVQVEGYSEGKCANGTCSGAAGGSASCSALPGEPRGGLGASLLLIVGALGTVLAARRRTR